MSEKETKSQIVTVRLNQRENKDLEELAEFFGTTKSDVLLESMRMVRDLKQVVRELLRDDPELAHVLKNSLVPDLLKAEYRRDKVGQVAEKILIGLIMKDMIGAGKRAKLALKLLEE